MLTLPTAEVGSGWGNAHAACWGGKSQSDERMPNTRSIAEREGPDGSRSPLSHRHTSPLAPPMASSTSRCDSPRRRISLPSRRAASELGSCTMRRIMLTIGSAVKHQCVACGAGIRQHVAMRARTLGQRVEEARVECGWSQRKLERECGLGDGQVSRIEADLRPNLSAEVLVKLARALHVREGWLWDGSGPVDPQDSAAPAVTTVRPTPARPATERPTGTRSRRP